MTRSGTYAVATPVPTFSKKVMAGWFERHLDDEAEVYSDGLGAFRAGIDLEHAHTVIGVCWWQGRHGGSRCPLGQRGAG